MASLRLRLLIGSSLASAAIVLLAGMILYTLIRQSLLAEFDRETEAELRVLASQVDSDDGRIRLEFDNPTVTQFRRLEHPEFFELRAADGSAVQRSPSLGHSDLPALDTTLDKVFVQELLLPNGQRGREASLTFLPVKDEHKNKEKDKDHETDMAGVHSTISFALGRDTARLDHVLSRIAFMLAATGVIATLAITGLLQIVVRRGLRPLDGLGRDIRRIGAQDLSVRVASAAAPAELVPVIDGLNQLLARLEEAFRREKSLTADVAHELRTPLYGLRSKLEVTLSKSRDAAEYSRVADDCLAITLSMQAIIENLLTLARLEGGQINQVSETVDVPVLLKECWAPFAERSQSRRLNVTWRLEPLAVESDREKLRMMVTNLFDNAVDYTDANGSLIIATNPPGAAPSLEIANTGSQVSGDDVAHVFDRFWRGDAARTNVGLHCGLGLALVRELADTLGAKITAESYRGGWFRIRLQLDTAGSYAANTAK